MTKSTPSTNFPSVGRENETGQNSPKPTASSRLYLSAVFSIVQSKQPLNNCIVLGPKPSSPTRLSAWQQPTFPLWVKKMKLDKNVRYLQPSSRLYSSAVSSIVQLQPPQSNSNARDPNLLLLSPLTLTGSTCIVQQVTRRKKVSVKLNLT